MELLAGLEPATSTYDHPSAAAAPGTPVSKRRALPFELQELRTSRQLAVGRKQKQTRCLLLTAYCLLLTALVGEDRIELSPRVPRTRMLALHHTPK